MGDGVIQAGEECDDGPESGWDGCMECRIREFHVNTTRDLEQIDPSTAISPDGRFVVAWSSEDPLKVEMDLYIAAQRYDASARKLGGEMRLSLPSEAEWSVESFGVAAGMSIDGGFAAVWQRAEHDDLALMIRVFDATGRPLDLEFRSILIPCTALPDLSMTSGGTFVVSGCGMGDLPALQRYGPEGGAEGSPVLAGTMAASGSSVALYTDGSFVAAWSYAEGNRVVGSLFDASGSVLADSFSVSSGSSFQRVEPRVAAAPDGRFVVVWASRDEDGDDWGVYARLFDEDGDPVHGSEMQINDDPVGAQEHPDVAMAGDGSFVVVWHNDPAEPEDRDVYMRRFSSSGEPEGPSSLVHTHVALGQLRPDVSMAPDGRYVVAWISYDQEGDRGEIFAQRFDASGNPLGTLPW